MSAYQRCWFYLVASRQNNAPTLDLSPQASWQLQEHPPMMVWCALVEDLAASGTLLDRAYGTEVNVLFLGEWGALSNVFTWRV
jgi:hypothetical protein